MGVTVLLGGARSGKSTLAVRMGVRSNGPVTFIATAEAGDDDMSARIRKHREERPTTWVTVEAPHDLSDAVSGANTNAFVVIDCLTLWVANRMLAGRSCAHVECEAEKIAASAARHASDVVIISNEVGMGVVPPTALGRDYRDALGRVNAIVASRADAAYLVVAGRLLSLKQADEAIFT